MDGLDKWLPTITFVVGLAVMAWKGGGVITELKTLLSELTKDVVEVKADGKQIAARIAAVEHAVSKRPARRRTK